MQNNHQKDLLDKKITHYNKSFVKTLTNSKAAMFADGSLKCICLLNSKCLKFVMSNWRQSTLIQVITWSRQAPSHYLNQCWTISLRHLWLLSTPPPPPPPPPPAAAYMRQWIGLALVQIMACRLSDTKPLPKPVLSNCQLDHWEQTSVKFESENKTFHRWVENVVCLRNRDHLFSLSERWVNNEETPVAHFTNMV